MGNIADALKKAGVELTDLAEAGDEQKTGSQEVGGGLADGGPDRSAGKDFAHATNERTTGTVTYGPRNERINLVLNNPGTTAEAFRLLRSKILFPRDGKSRPRTIMIASSAPGEGKSFISVNLAVTIAKGLDQYALLVDCDLRQPSLADLLGMVPGDNRGLADYLTEDLDLADLIRRTPVEKLSLLPGGTPPRNPAELLTSVRMSRLVNELSGRYSDRFIIFDTPPFQVASESLVLANKVDGVVVVVGYGKSDRVKVREMIDTIGPDKVLGVVFNGQKDGYIKKKMLDPYGTYGKYYNSSKN